MKKGLFGKFVLAIFVVLLILSADQFLKFWVKTNMVLGENGEIPVIANWFKLHFTENDGMAFGLTFGRPDGKGKLFLTLFRLVAVSGIIYYLIHQIRNGAKKGTIILIALILAGALGNIIDSVFYGLWFTQSHVFGLPAEWAVDGNNYGKLFYGKVVDMFYFPLFQGTYPSWFPVVGGQPFTFFSAIFNLADASISIGLISILVFKRELFGNSSIVLNSESKDTEMEEFGQDTLTEETK
ncbi:MAG: lipoprotein signal peptidase [Flavobacteriales bacterium]|nr:lipoprotein signal peptidase [Flavobacteriales bacterium]